MIRLPISTRWTSLQPVCWPENGRWMKRDVKAMSLNRNAHWKSYILMEIITPPALSNIILRNGAVESGGVICELGVYGTCLWDQKTGKVLHNEKAGYLLRTKGDKSEEGGVAAGFGSMDSVRLV